MRKYVTKLISVFFFLQIFPFQTFAQFFDFPSEVLDTADLCVTYTLKWKQDTNNLEHIRQEDMILLIGKKISLFMSNNTYQLLILGRKAERDGMLHEFLRGTEIQNYRSRFRYRIYKNYPSGRMTYASHVIPAFLKYEENIDVFEWQLTSLVDTIGDYVAHCAYTNYGGRHWVAWYTTEIPINDGPYKFRGLPGLIIRLYDDKEHYVFDMVKMERSNEAMLIEYDDMDWVQTSRSDFLKAEENFRIDIVSRAKEAAANSESQQAAARNMARRNNPIEF
jgi:GLPGLI family protein